MEQEVEVIECGNAFFSVEGEFFTSTARDLMLSDRPGRAWRLVTDSLMGEGAEEAARGILDGTHKLTGVNELDLVEEVPGAADEYLKQLRYIYAGRVRIGNAWYRPAAYVRPSLASSRYANNDIRDFKDATVSEWMLTQARYYLEEGEVARIAWRQGKQVCMIFEACSEPPIWWDEVNFNDAVDDAEKHGRKIPTRGNGAEEVLRAMQSSARIVEDDVVRATWAAQEEEDARREQQYRDECDRIAAKVLERSQSSIELELGDGTVVNVPREPFVNWALRRTEFLHLAPEWDRVSPPDFKMQCDSRDHTDWMLGAGIDLSRSYDDDVKIPAYMKAMEIQEELCGFEAYVVNDAGSVYGQVGIEVMVLPTLGVEYAVDVMANTKCRAIIAESGGGLSHLAIVGREKGLTIMLVDDAMERFGKLPKEKYVSVVPREGKVEVR